MFFTSKVNSATRFHLPYRKHQKLVICDWAVKMTSQILKWNLWKCSAIPEDGRRKAYAEAVARAKAEEEALQASMKAQEAAQAARKLEEEVKKLSEQEAIAASLAEEAQEKAQAVGSNIDKILSRAKSAGQDFSWEKLSSQFANPIKLKLDEVPKVQLATIRGQAKAQSLLPKKAIVKPPKQAKEPQVPQPKLKRNEQKAEIRNVFGGLFKQETIYIDDDWRQIFGLQSSKGEL